MIIGSSWQLVRQEGEGHRPESFDLRAHGIGGRLLPPEGGCPLARGIFRCHPEPPRRLFGHTFALRQILLRKIQVGGDSVAEVSVNLEKVATSALRRAGPSGEGRGGRTRWNARIAPPCSHEKGGGLRESNRNFRNRRLIPPWIHPTITTNGSGHLGL